MDIQEKVRGFLRDNFPDAILREDNFRNQQSFFIRRDSLVPMVEALIDETDLDCRYLCDITSVDWLGNEKEIGGRFEVIYNFFSLTHHNRFFLKVMLPAEEPEIDSLTQIFNSANWLEREIWDMMGIKFTGHPDLTKILTPDELEGHPLRRDFPLTWEQPRFTWNKDDPPEVVR